MAQNFNMVTPQRVTLTLAVILTAMALSGAVGECEAFGQAKGAQQDFADLQDIFDRVQPPLTPAEQQAATRRACLNAYGVLYGKRSRKDGAAVAAVDAAMARGATTRRMFLRYLRMWRGATRIQAAFRGYLGRRDHVALRAAAVCAQKTRKRAVARRAFLERKKSAVAIQAAVRGWIARERYNDARFTAVLLQARVRGAAKRREFLELRGAVLAAQRRFRAARLAHLSRAAGEAADP